MGARSSSSKSSWASRSATAVAISCLGLMRCQTSSSRAKSTAAATGSHLIQQAEKLLPLRNRHRHVNDLFHNASNDHHLGHRDVNILIHCALLNGRSWSNVFVHGSQRCIGHNVRWSGNTWSRDQVGRAPPRQVAASSRASEEQIRQGEATPPSLSTKVTWPNGAVPKLSAV